MRPYPRLQCCLRVYLLLLVCLPLPAAAQGRTAAPAGSPKAIRTPAPALQDDRFTRLGFQHYYDLDYAAAVTAFERALQTHPDEPAAVNHLLNAVLFRELYRVGALETGLYSTNKFLGKRKIELDPKVRARVQELTQRALELSEKRLEADPRDVQALYCRGATRSLRALYIGMVERAWFSALRSAVGAKKDHERVLELDPEFVDARTVVGVHNYIAGSLPWTVKIAASLVGMSGSKKRGLEYLQQAAEGGSETAIDARVALSLFLRREERFLEALEVVRGLLADHPRNFLFALEEANILNDVGRGPEAAAAYRQLLERGRQGFFPEPHLELAAYGLGEALRGQRHFAEAAQAYELVGTFPKADRELRLRAQLAAGQMHDLLLERDLALKSYQAVIAMDPDSPQAGQARKHLKRPYTER